MSSTAQTESGGSTAIPVRRVIVQHSVPVPGLTHLEATAIHVTVVGRAAKILEAYISPSPPLIGADLTASFAGIPGLYGVNAKHLVLNLRRSIPKCL